MQKKINLYWSNLFVDKINNFGDILSPSIIKELSGGKINLVSCSFTLYSFRGILYYIKQYLKLFQLKRIIKLFSGHFQHKIMAIGSIIHFSDNKTIVWGAGLIRRGDKIKGGNFLAVRGAVTQQRLKELGFKVPNVIGDPALLLRRTYIKNIEPVYEYGIIPHYADYKLVVEKLNIPNSKILIIDVLTDDPYKVVDKIRLCKNILSSSLHGIIISHTYCIPAVWCKFSGNIGGDDSKFEDYLLSVNLEFYKPCEISNYEILKSPKILLDKYKNVLLPDSDIIDKVCDNLLSVAPFNIKNKYIKVIL